MIAQTGEVVMMVNLKQVLFVIFIFISVPLSGCNGSTTSTDEISFQGELLIEIENPCLNSTQSITQSMTSILVNEEERIFRLSVPSSEAGTKLPIVIAFMEGVVQKRIFNNKMNSIS